MNRPKPQELYRHFKGGKYQIITIARDADTGEEQVVYQALYGDYTIYCRSLKEFTSEVDRERYPNPDQKMRFELFTPDVNEYDIKSDFDVKDEIAKKPALEETESAKKPVLEIERSSDKKSDSDTDSKNQEESQKESIFDDEDKDDINENYMNRTIEEEAESFGMNPLVVQFLDANSTADRLEVLSRIRPIVTNEMIDIMAMAMDTEIPGDDPDVRCSELRQFLLTKQKFEVSRRGI
ncbi:DUF1653 domain-containing protein [Butyrivibrio sp. JL13D10]|uniref:DUF1653 domain-containing protein n=1 Tax=Butyrivibrio sp. JL13D10 TaxID=3236815 RepID=UPI0038B4EFBF